MTVKFETAAWVYAVMYHGVALGSLKSAAILGTTTQESDDAPLIFTQTDSVNWHELFNFHNKTDFDWSCVTELRIFNEERELRFMRGMDNQLILRDSLTLASYEPKDSSYLMYGTRGCVDGEWTTLSEDRGGELYFPAAVNTANGLWLNVCNFLHFTSDMRLEVVDYTFTGFKYEPVNDTKGCSHA